MRNYVEIFNRLPGDGKIDGGGYPGVRFTRRYSTKPLSELIRDYILPNDQGKIGHPASNITYGILFSTSVEKSLNTVKSGIDIYGELIRGVAIGETVANRYIRDRFFSRK